MSNIKIKIEGYDGLLLKLSKIAEMDLKRKVDKATALVHGQAVSLAPTGVSGGAGLSGSIRMETKRLPKAIQGKVYTNLEYAPYVEFGTGIKGNGTYPYNIKGLNLAYKDAPWFIPASEISDKVAEKYHFTKIYGKNGSEYYICYGQEAQPYMYPALKLNEKKIRAIMSEGVKETLRDICKGGK